MRIGADLVVANDPDADRCAVASAAAHIAKASSARVEARSMLRRLPTDLANALGVSVAR